MGIYNYFSELRYRAAALLLLAALVAMTSISAFASDNRVNINLADQATLETSLEGVGPALARRIVEFREMYGPFESLDQFLEVKGVGPKIVETNQGKIVFE
ncbi:MAG: helix-hairpin-helix domain-containing protein [Luminiphilus sp.]|nr:helix-hairpin-helix domain-containing protein [Luminiphilus sp.]